MSERQNQRLIEAEGQTHGNLRCLDASTSKSFMDMPNEIMCMIIGFLPRPWTLSLGLTCKFLSKVTEGEFRTRLEGLDRVKFLTTLQKDVANAYYCYCCDRLRRLDPSHDWKIQHHAGGTSDFKNSRWLPDIHHILHVRLPKNLFLLLSKANISFMEPYLVMNRHFLGLSHGISLQSLERYVAYEAVINLDRCSNFLGPVTNYRVSLVHTDLEPCLKRKTQLPGRRLEAAPRREDAWRFTFRMTPKIIDDKLFIRRAYTIVGPLVSQEALQRLIETMSIPICSHLSASASPSCCHPGSDLPTDHVHRCPVIRYRQFFYRRWNDRRVAENEPGHSSCVLCSTDYEMSLKRETLSNETHLSITTWHCLGSCRSPDDELWSHFVSALEHPSFWATAITFSSDDGSQSPVHRYTPQQDSKYPDRPQEYTCLIPESYNGAVRRTWIEAADSE
ncbi:hypothetical protein HDV57DRAFT_22902 [Trichoderma longibrachiatum]|uniref:F-box domain-containing protein n=1 Tax=Trichoderma longibrachiatum ATCC 18648 TaxID=983965 RepID=A0A2T4CIL3_TRILO|nr:hypothetical protein M440DRAFT_1466909 [Trichoderma longibrachiatum ATCC 18648]